MDAWAWGLRRVAPSRPRATRGIELGVFGATGLAPPKLLMPPAPFTFTIPATAYPFVAPIDLIWKTLPGESWVGTASNYVPDGLPHASKMTRFRNRAEENLMGVICAAGSSYYSETAGKYVERALLGGTRFFHGKGLWGCTEKVMLAGVTWQLDKWLNELRPVEAALDYQAQHQGRPRSVPAALAGEKREVWASRWPPDVLARLKALIAELEWAKAYFSSVIQLITYAEGEKSSGDATVKEEMQSNAALGVGYLGASWPFGQFGRASLAPMIKLASLKNLYMQRAGTFAHESEVAIAFFTRLYDLLNSKALHELTTGLTSLGSAISTFPFAGTIAYMATRVTSGLINAYTETGIDHATRGDKAVGRKDVETYMIMSLRAVVQAVMGAQLVVRGVHPLQKAGVGVGVGPGVFRSEAKLLVAPPPPGEGRFRPEAERRLLVQPPEEAPPGEQKALSTTAKTGLVLGGGVAAAALIWWLSRRRR